MLPYSSLLMHVGFLSGRKVGRPRLRVSIDCSDMKANQKGPFMKANQRAALMKKSCESKEGKKANFVSDSMFRLLTRYDNVISSKKK